MCVEFPQVQYIGIFKFVTIVTSVHLNLSTSGQSLSDW